MDAAERMRTGHREVGPFGCWILVENPTNQPTELILKSVERQESV